MLYNGIRFYTMPDGYAVLAEWKRAAFPAIWHGKLRKDWVPNKDCPPDGKVLMNYLNRSAFVNVRTYAELRRMASVCNTSEPYFATPLQHPWLPER